MLVCPVKMVSKVSVTDDEAKQMYDIFIENNMTATHKPQHLSCISTLIKLEIEQSILPLVRSEASQFTVKKIPQTQSNTSKTRRVRRIDSVLLRRLLCK